MNFPLPGSASEHVEDEVDYDRPESDSEPEPQGKESDEMSVADGASEAHVSDVPEATLRTEAIADEPALPPSGCDSSGRGVWNSGASSVRSAEFYGELDIDPRKAVDGHTFKYRGQSTEDLLRLRGSWQDAGWEADAVKKPPSAVEAGHFFNNLTSEVPRDAWVYVMNIEANRDWADLNYEEVDDDTIEHVLVQMDNLLRRNGQASSRHNGAVLYMNTGGWVRTQVLAEHLGVSEDVITFVTRISGEALYEGARLKLRDTGRFRDKKMKWVRAGDRHCFDWVTLERTATRLNYKALSVLECLCYVTEGERVADILSCGLRTRKLTGPVEDSHAYNSHTNSLHPYFPWEQEAGKSLSGRWDGHDHFRPSPVCRRR